MKESKSNGFGVCVWEDGATYEGQWKDGQRTKGKQTWPNGLIYEGEFKNEYPNGQGKKTLTDGTVNEGVWVNDQLVDQLVE